jgi:hypothetical protein
MTKSPYEIRLELLAMAQSIISDQTMNDRIKLENDWSLEREKASIALAAGVIDVTLPPFPEVPKMSEESIIKMAEKLNAFVSKGS